MTGAAITQAHVCGPLGQALVVIGEETWLYEAAGRRRPSCNDIRFFFDHGLEVRPIGPPSGGSLDASVLRTIIDEEIRKFRALHGVLYGLDPEFDDATRTREMRRASDCLPDPAVAEFVSRRFLRPRDKTAWDIPHGLELARRSDLPLIVRLYAIVDGPLPGWVEDTIREWASQQGFGSARCAELVQQSYDSGLVAAVAGSAHDEDLLRAFMPFFTGKFDGDMAHWDLRLVEHLLNALIGPVIPAGPTVSQPFGAAMAAGRAKRKVRARTG